MKTTLFNAQGIKKSEIEMPKTFSSEVREDIVSKYFEADKSWQPYSSNPEAGKRHTASGSLAHRRHKWKTQYGKGMARTPRKTMYRRGTQFFWVGAEVSNTRGGRVSHPPRGIRRFRKINAREIGIAMNSGFAATANKNYILQRYSSLNDIKKVDAPYVIESLPDKTSQALETLEKIFAPIFNLIIKHKVVRSGKGKTRGRKYKSNAGLLVLTGKDEIVKLNGVDVKPIDEVEISDLYPLGRLTLYTKKALDALSGAKK